MYSIPDVRGGGGSSFCKTSGGCKIHVSFSNQLHVGLLYIHLMLENDLFTSLLFVLFR